MKRIAGKLIGWIACGLSCASAFGQTVVINEIHYNPPASAGADAEFIELYNAGASPANLTGWTISNGVVYSFPSGTTIPVGGYLVIAKNAALLQAATGFSGALQWTSGSLDNGGETVSISNASAVIVDTVSYDDVAPWPTAPDGGGKSLELISPTLDNSLASSWAASLGNNGTPGAQNSVFVSAPVLVARTPVPKTMVAALPSVSVTFDRVVTGVTAGALTVNGSASTSFSGSGAGPYLFSGFASPTPGSVTIALAGTGILDGSNVAFGGAAWTVAVGTNIVINELNYHPNELVYPAQETEFIELYNAGANNVDMSGWEFTNGITYTIPNGTTLNAGAYLVVAVNSAALQAATGYAAALQWTSGGLSNSGEKVGIADASLNQIDLVDYADSGAWPGAADGDGPSLELRNPAYPNEFGAAWGASIPNNGTPGAQNSIFQAALGPIIIGTAHLPIIPAANQAVTITATVVDDSPNPTVTLYYRQDQDPTIAYSSTPMLDDGAHGDGAAGDKLYGAVVPGLADGQRLDFTIRADDGGIVSAAPNGNNTLVAGENPNQTYLCKFSNAALSSDFPSYHLITTQHIRNLQTNAIEDEFDSTFVHCDTAGNCKNFYNSGQHYRGASSLNQLPHSYRIDLPNSPNFDSELGFRTTKIDLLSQAIHKQYLGMQFFREAFGGQIPTPRTQFVRFNTNPLSEGGTQDYVYHNIEVLDGSFLESQRGDVTPLRWPDRCSTSLSVCGSAADCSGVQTCVSTDDGNLYRGRNDGARLNYKGPDKNAYRTDANGANGYQKYTNEAEDNWDDLITLSFALDATTTPDAIYEATVSPLIDEDEWVKWFAIHMLLVNQEGGIYRDTGDDYFLYFQRQNAPGGYNAKMLPWDMDSTFGGFGDTYVLESIWRTTVASPRRFIRSNEYAGRFVKAICDMMGNEFLQPTMNAKIDALPTAVADAARKTQLKNWVSARRASIQSEIKTQLTISNLPGSPYRNVNSALTLVGQLNQCGTRYVRINGQNADFLSVFSATWVKTITLTPGLNSITVQCLDYTNTEISRIDTSVFYDPAPLQILVTAPSRMVDSKTLTLKAEILDVNGRIDWQTCATLGTVSATRVSDGTPVPISVTTFETLNAGVGANGPITDTLRFYNGAGSVSITLDQGADTPPGDINVVVTVGSLSASKIVTVLDGDNPALFKSLSGTLSGADLSWSPANGVIRLTGDVVVDAGNTLTIQPGTLIMADSGSPSQGVAIIAQNGGVVSALGTQTSPIFFFPTAGPSAMSLPQAIGNNDASWRGIQHSQTGSSQYRYVFLTGAGNGPASGLTRPAIVSASNTHGVTLDRCVFADCPGAGLFVAPGASGSSAIRNSMFSRLGIGGAWLGAGYSVDVEDSWFTRIGRAPSANGVDGDALIFDQAGGTAHVRRCLLTDCGDDLIEMSNGAAATIEDSILSDARDTAVVADASITQALTMTNSLVFNAPGGARCNGRAANLSLCTIGQNAILDGAGCGSTAVDRCVLWPSSLSTCCGAVNNSIVGNQGDLGCGTGNSSQDPLFVLPFPSGCSYQLLGGSPALAAGPGGTRIGWQGFTGPRRGGLMSISPAGLAALPGSTTSLDVFLQFALRVRSYTTVIAITRTSGTGSVSVDCPGGVSIATGRTDHVFYGLGGTPSTNCTLRVASDQLASGSVDVGSTAKYLSTYMLHVSPDAAEGSTFEIRVVGYGGSILGDSVGAAVAFEAAPPTVLTIGECPTADAGSDQLVCSPSSVSLGGTSLRSEGCTWSTSGDGLFDDPGAFGAIYTPGPNDAASGFVTLTLTCQPLAPCVTPAQDSMQVSFVPPPVLEAGADQSLCHGTAAQVSASAIHTSGCMWLTSGDGVFGDASHFSTSYTPGTSDSGSGNVVLTFQCNAEAPCQGPVSDTLHIHWTTGSLTGDMNADGVTNGDDITSFVRAVIAQSTQPADVCAGDFSLNGQVSVEDISGMIGVLLGT